MNVLGLIAGDAGGHPAACVLKDGKLIALAEEERFVRVKQAPGYFPSHAIRYCLSEAKLTIDDVHAIAFGWDATAYRFRFPAFLAWSFITNRLSRRRAARVPHADERPALGSAVLSGIESLVSYQPRRITENIVLGLKEAGLNGKRLPPVVFIKHHLAHAASAFYASGFEESAVLIFDGHGEENTTSLFRGEGRKIERLKTINVPHSLGWFYAAFTEYLGFNPSEGEVKLMGLAPFGGPNPEVAKKLDGILELTSDGFRIDANCLFYGERRHGKFFSDAVVERLGPPRGRYDEITPWHKDVAWAVQNQLERAALHLARTALGLARSENLCLAGGVALNCKMNGEIWKSGIAKRLFVQPVAYDAGASLGAAMALAMERGDDCRFRMDHLYWGPSFDNDSIRAVLDANRVPYRQSRDVAVEAARLLAEGKIAGWFQGRMECGPRALGGRSILADPRPKEMKDLVNDRVKFREAWRPFALSILEEHFESYVKKPAPSPFMIMAFEVNEDKADGIQSGMHWIDRTTRPQTVSRTTNPLYWQLIESFRELTGVPALLNTSFNVKDEPIVCSPRDALRCFYGCGMDALVMGDFILEK